jgi:hypothetical protein
MKKLLLSIEVSGFLGQLAFDFYLSGPYVTERKGWEYDLLASDFIFVCRCYSILINS